MVSKTIIHRECEWFVVVVFVFTVKIYFEKKYFGNTPG